MGIIVKLFWLLKSSKPGKDYILGVGKEQTSRRKKGIYPYVPVAAQAHLYGLPILIVGVRHLQFGKWAFAKLLLPVKSDFMGRGTYARRQTKAAANE